MSKETGSTRTFQRWKSVIGANEAQVFWQITVELSKTTNQKINLLENLKEIFDIKQRHCGKTN